MEHLLQMLAILLLIPALLAVHILIHLAITGITRRLTTTIERRPILCFAAGAVAFAALLLLGRHVQPAAPFVLVVLGFFLIIGLPAMSLDLGRRVLAIHRGPSTPLATLSCGWLTFAFASLVPVVGWFVIFPWLCLTAAGSLIVAHWVRE